MATLDQAIKSGIKILENTVEGKIKDSTKSSHYTKTPQVPDIFWCGHFLDLFAGSGTIQDGENCCFMHWVGLPRRWQKRHPLYPWQEDILNDLNNGVKFFFHLKPPKIGATQFWLLWALFQAIKNPKWRYGQVGIVVATSGREEAEKMIERTKEILVVKSKDGKPMLDKNDKLLYKYPINQGYNTKREFTINTVKFRAFPAQNDHINAIRSQPNMQLIMGDEVAFFSTVDQNKIRDAFEHYIGGSDTIIALITTAGNSPSGFAYDVYKEEPSIYKKIIHDYHVGLIVHPESQTSLYRKSDIEKIKHLPSFQKNYLHQWGYGEGDIFDSRMIQLISTSDYELKDISKLPNGLFVDPAYGKQRTKTSSKFALLGLYQENGIIYTRSLKELEEPSDEEGLIAIRHEIKTYGYKLLIVDGHWTGIKNTFRSEISTDGYNFGDVGLEMTDNASTMVTDMKVRIHPSHEQLIQQLRAIKRNEKGLPDKTQSRFDAGDCFLMGCYYFANRSTGYAVAGPITRTRHRPLSELLEPSYYRDFNFTL